MNKYKIMYYNRFACETQSFYVIANDEEHAEQLFYLKYDKESYHDCIEYISSYYEPHFYTEEEIILQKTK